MPSDANLVCCSRLTTEHPCADGSEAFSSYIDWFTRWVSSYQGFLPNHQLSGPVYPAGRYSHAVMCTPLDSACGPAGERRYFLGWVNDGFPGAVPWNFVEVRYQDLAIRNGYGAGMTVLLRQRYICPAHHTSYEMLLFELPPQGRNDISSPPPEPLREGGNYLCCKGLEYEPRPRPGAPVDPRTESLFGALRVYAERNCPDARNNVDVRHGTFAPEDERPLFAVWLRQQGSEGENSFFLLDRTDEANAVRLRQVNEGEFGRWRAGFKVLGERRLACVDHQRVFRITAYEVPDEFVEEV